MASKHQLKGGPSAETIKFAKSVGRALKRAQKSAREIARQHGTPIHVMRNGKVVALKP
jgi:high-affinity K+ transport system ATPase subunit B